VSHVCLLHAFYRVLLPEFAYYSGNVAIEIIKLTYYYYYYACSTQSEDTVDRSREISTFLRWL